MSELAPTEDYFFDDPGYWAEKTDVTEPPEVPTYVKGFIDIRPEVAAITGIAEARIRARSESDDTHLEGEQ